MRTRFWIALAATLAGAAPLEAQRASTKSVERTEAARSSTARWTAAEAHRWYNNQPWIVGANYANASAINQLDMFQAATWNPKEIDRELGWAKQFGMNTMRVYLHASVVSRIRQASEKWWEGLTAHVTSLTTRNAQLAGPPWTGFTSI